MKPKMFGYLSISAHVTDQHVERLQWEIATYADAQGYELAGTFIDRRGKDTGLTSLREALKRDGVRHVVVPHGEHLNALAHTCDDPRTIARRLGAQVHTVYPNLRPSVRRLHWGGLRAQRPRLLSAQPYG